MFIVCRFFYDGQLLDGAGISAVSKGARFHSKLAFRPFVMWDCREGRERGAAAGAGGSLRNIAEAQMAATLVAGRMCFIGQRTDWVCWFFSWVVLVQLFIIWLHSLISACCYIV